MAELHHDCPLGSTIYSFYRRWGLPKLFRYADRGKWDKIPQRAQRFPHEAKFVHRYAPCDKALHRLVRPLHVPCPFLRDDKGSDEPYRNSTDVLSPKELDEAREKERLMNEINCPFTTDLLLSAVRAILEADPTSASHANLFGRTPLHLACMDLTPARACAAAVILEHTPMTARMMDKRGCTPLHYLLKNPAKRIPIDLLVKFLEYDDKALDRTNVEGKKPEFLADCDSAGGREDRDSDRAREIRQILQRTRAAVAESGTTFHG